MNEFLDLLSARWLIHRETAISYLPAFISFLNGGADKLAAFTDPVEEKKRHAPKGLAIQAGTFAIASEYDLMDPQLPENSIAMIPIQGAIMPGKSMQLVNYIRQAKANPNINAVIFMVNSPGGTVFYTDILANEVKSLGKPSVAAIQNMSASAAMWVCSAMDYRIATSPMDWIGSIGVMASITDMQVLLKEKLGINVYDIYAEKSTKKNELARALQQTPPDFSAAVEDLNFINEIFHKAIQDNLNIDPSSEVFSGGIYNAQAAISHGLINEINSLDFAVERACKQGLIFKAHSQYQSLNLTVK
jgi:protease-4